MFEDKRRLVLTEAAKEMNENEHPAVNELYVLPIY